MYRLKKGQPPIEVVDGPMAGRSFIPGQAYKDIPATEKCRFEKVKAVAPAQGVKAEKERSAKNA